MTREELEESVRKVLREERDRQGTGRADLAQDVWDWIHSHGEGEKISLGDVIKILEAEMHGERSHLLRR